MALASRVMRQVLINYARDRHRLKRGGPLTAHTLLDEHAAAEAPFDLLLAVNDALEKLAARNPRMGLIVEYRFFGGMTVEEAAAYLKVSGRTVRREWRMARAFLSAEIEGTRSDDARAMESG